jgi:hypothetical protein
MPTVSTAPVAQVVEEMALRISVVLVSSPHRFAWIVGRLANL